MLRLEEIDNKILENSKQVRGMPSALQSIKKEGNKSIEIEILEVISKQQSNIIISNLESKDILNLQAKDY